MSNGGEYIHGLRGSRNMLIIFFKSNQFKSYFKPLFQQTDRKFSLSHDSVSLTFHSCWEVSMIPETQGKSVHNGFCQTLGSIEVCQISVSVPCLESRNIHHGRVGTPQPRIQPSRCNTWPFCGALPRYEPLGPHPWDRKFSLLPYVSPSALKVTPLSFFLLFKLKWLRQLTSTVFNMAIGIHLQYYITSLCFKFSHFSHDQPEKTNSFGFINKLLYCIYHRVKGLIVICGSRIE